MRFDTLTFAIFFVIVLALYNSRLSWAFRKTILLAASLIFYAAWNPPFVLLLMASTIGDFYIARGIACSPALSTRKCWLAASLVCNLGLLFFFKYSGFLVENLTGIFASFGIICQPLPFSIILPVGISFYTFQTLSYTIDVYRGHLKADWSLLDYSLYVCFFPQLVAGPIVRSDQFLPQTIESKRSTIANLLSGIGLMVLGLFEKVVLADGVFAPVADGFFNATSLPTGLAAWSGLLAFSGQIFCDFAGYSSCAIGAARCLGFRLPTNFWCPYAAIGLSDFWSRWHISLSTWFRDYLYIPLGGNRSGAARTNLNLLFTMLVSGLWHGAAWTFILWGAMHGFLLLLERWARRVFSSEEPKSFTEKCPTLFRQVAGFFGALATFGLVTICWLPFRCASLESVVDSMTAMATWSLKLDRSSLFSLVVIVLLFLTQFALRSLTIDDLVEKLPSPVTGFGVALMAYLVVTFPRQDHSFIYFQF